MSDLYEIASLFLHGRYPKEVKPYGNGHINGTYIVTLEDGSDFILQRINTNVFKDVGALMNNCKLVTKHIKNKCVQLGRNKRRSTLNFLKVESGDYYYVTEDGAFRMSYFIDNSFSPDIIESPNMFYLAGKAFGEFANFLSDFDASKLVETIPNFHNTPVRYKNLVNAVKIDSLNRVEEVGPELQFVKHHKDFTKLFVSKINDGSLPLRVTHNDTKLNNVLFDKGNKHPIAIIDLDTVMPGSYLYDFGDAIRSGATHAAEDEQDLDLVDFDLGLFKAFTKGYLEESINSLTQEEIKMLPYAPIMLTLECGMRFLTDYLEGDTYFKTTRYGQNLDRARTQFKLVSEMEQNFEAMQEIVNECVKTTNKIF